MGMFCSISIILLFAILIIFEMKKSWSNGSERILVKKQNSYWKMRFPSKEKVKSSEQEQKPKFLSEKEMMELNEKELDEYGIYLKNWLKKDIKKTLTPTFLKSPLGDRKCAHENCEYGEFRSTGYCLEHKNKYFFDTFEIKTPGQGTNLFIAKKVLESNDRGSNAIIGGTAWVGLSIYDSLLSVLPDRYELAWRGITRGIVVAIIFWLFIIVPGISETYSCGDLSGAECNRGGASAIVLIFHLFSLITIVPMGAVTGLSSGILYYSYQEEKYLNQLNIRKKSSDDGNIQESNIKSNNVQKDNRVKYEPNKSNKKRKRCRYFFASLHNIPNSTSGMEPGNIRCTNYHYNRKFCDEHS